MSNDWNSSNWDSTDENSTNNPEPAFGDNPNGGDDAGTGDDSAGQTFQQLKQELEASKAQLQELTRISQQALADLSNYKKRTEEEKKKFVEFANANLMSELLPILDNFHRALEHAPADNAAKDWAAGVIAIFKQLEETLANFGLTKIDASESAFDPNVHEAITTSSGPKDQILKALQHGYKMGEKVLRRSKVVVGHGEEKSSTNQSE